MMVVVVAILSLWWKDHNELTRELSKYAAYQPNSNWSFNEVTGKPNTSLAGDIPTAWASATQDGQKEWLDLVYANSVWPTAVKIHETYNPGAVNKITAFRADGTEVVIWEGKDPTPTTSKRGVSVIPVKTDFPCKKIRVHIDSPAVPGWNEIDAVGLQTRWWTYWAESATGSSSFGENFSQQIQLGGVTPLITPQNKAF
jgi:hypothetical protein